MLRSGDRQTALKLLYKDVHGFTHGCLTCVVGRTRCFCTQLLVHPGNAWCYQAVACRYRGKLQSESDMLELVKHGSGFHLELYDLAEVRWPRLPLTVVNAVQLTDCWMHIQHPLWALLCSMSLFTLLAS